MLTADLLRATCRKGVIHPRYLDVDSPPLHKIAAGLIAVYRKASEQLPGWRRGQIEEAVADLVSERTDPLLFKGLCKLLEDRSEFAGIAEPDPCGLRRHLFEAAAHVTVRRVPGRPWDQARSELIGGTAREFALSEQELEERLYGDLEGNLRLTAFRPLSPRQLLERYNLALAQAVLLRATQMVVTLEAGKVGAYRQLFRDLKFFQLIHTVQELADGRYQIRVDGPLSLFTHSRRYGVAMAQFLPSVLWMERFELEARVRGSASKEELLFRLDHRRGLTPQRRASGQYVTAEQTWFEQRFEQNPGPWEMSREPSLLRTGEGEIVIPDLCFRHQDGRHTVFLEIIGFWRKATLSARLRQLTDPALDRLLIAASRQLASDKEATPVDHPRIIWFATVLPVGSVKQKLERLAQSANG
ncbi:MAG: DUF790 family protein [Bradymonadales bacterium]|nr:DUF790 family protein [Bradymonadales bacterium]